MKLADFEWQTKRPRVRTEDAGRQIVLDFGQYHISIIDDGYGREDGLYEIGLFDAQDGVATDMTSLPGITNEDDTVRGYLSEDEVNAILKKLHSITTTLPTQI